MTVPLAESVKLCAKTFRLTVVVALKEPDVPVMVSVYCPRLAVLLAVSVSTLAPVAGFGLHDAVTPLGRPEVTARLTPPLNPYWEFTFTVDVLKLPWPKVTLL
jgi:hypothetical protein